ARIADTQTHPASGRRPGTVGKTLRWQTATGTRARSSETGGEALPPYTTASGLLKQPDKQEPPSGASWQFRGFRRIGKFAISRQFALWRQTTSSPKGRDSRSADFWLLR